ncbi:MAG: DUF2961 domain-containing protein [Tannerellaceae bacterium]|nr:DUF2961 domain-containing protein [Tannerellaceae bacterium]
MAVAMVCCCFLFSCWGGEGRDVTLIGLLDEMTSAEEGARYPAMPYRALSVSGQTTATLFNRQGPGVITHIFLISENKEDVVRFYFDGASEAEITLPAYTLSLPDILEESGGLLYNHPDPKGGSALYLPIPFDKSCRITLENAADNPASGFYRIDFRQYPENTSVETFSLKKPARLKKKIADVNHWLLHPESARPTREPIQGEALLEAGAPVVIKLPKGENAVYELQVQIMPSDEEYAQTMRNVILQGIFDGKQTVRIPVGDFSGGGMKASAVDSRYLWADGNGSVLSRWLMPYMEKASLAFINEGRKGVRLRYVIHVAPLPWDERMLYFHASWKEETGIPIRSSEENPWNFASVGGGRGVYKGDVWTLFNHTSGWYGQGGDQIGTENDAATAASDSHLDHYYNNARRPVRAFQTPFGGAPCAERDNSYGYNTFFRIRLLDGIPFARHFQFDMGWRGEKTGTVDCATTIFWYGDRKTRPGETSRPDVTARKLPLSSVPESGESDR